MRTKLTENQQTTNTKGSKPGYDARLGYHKILEDIMNNISTAIIKNDIQLWVRSLNAYYNHVYAFISKDKDIKERLRNISRQVLFTKIQLTPGTKMHLIEKIMDINLELFEQSKYILLPISDSDISEMDMDDMFKMMGIGKGD